MDKRRGGCSEWGCVQPQRRKPACTRGEVSRIPGSKSCPDRAGDVECICQRRLEHSSKAKLLQQGWQSHSRMLTWQVRDRSGLLPMRYSPLCCFFIRLLHTYSSDKVIRTTQIIRRSSAHRLKQSPSPEVLTQSSAMSIAQIDISSIIIFVSVIRGIDIPRIMW